MLKLVPHKNFLDLAVVYYVRIDDIGIVIVNNLMMEKLGITHESLDHAAYINTEKTMTIKPMMSVLGTCGLPAFFPEDDNFMFVGTNETLCYGAAILIYPEYFAGLAETVKANLFILPSSIHDVIIVPDNGTVEAEELEMMVWEINRNKEVIDQKDVLSDSIYYYNRHTGKIEIIK